MVTTKTVYPRRVLTTKSIVATSRLTMVLLQKRAEKVLQKKCHLLIGKYVISVVRLVRLIRYLGECSTKASGAR